jgi:hypothetical protein
VINAIGGELDMAGTGNTNTTTGQIQASTGATVDFLQGLATNAGVIALSGSAVARSTTTASRWPMPPPA